MIKLKRAYDPPEENDGFRVLLDRLWPRGVSKEEAALTLVYGAWDTEHNQAVTLKDHLEDA